jgi:hypothetical protein
MSENLYILCLLAWVVIGVFSLTIIWGHQGQGTGLVLAFFCNMALIHWFSGVITFFPWYSSAEYSTTTAGFGVSTAGMVAFAIGCFGFAPLFFHAEDEMAPFRMEESDSKFLRLFLIIGIASLILGAVGARQIPSAAAILSGGQAFGFAGIGFGIWQSYLHQNRKQLLLCLAAAAAFPLLTLILQGFLGFGVGYTIIVLCFFVAIYRPRWTMALLVIPVGYLALSVFVTYMRDRNDIRSVVWGGGRMEERINQAEQTFQQFEWFDPLNRRHLDDIDRRLNYNWMVGAAMAHLRTPNDFGKGETLWMGVLAIIPRVLWPDKPIQAGSMNFVSHYTGVKFAEGTSVGMGLIFEFYVNFGIYGVLIGMLIVGTLVRYADCRAGVELRWGSAIAFARWFLIGEFLLLVGGSIIEIVPNLVLAVVLTAGLRYLYPEQPSIRLMEDSVDTSTDSSEP